MKIAYLINQYPTLSHSFIRREILALESLGNEVIRYSIRSGSKTPLSKVDLAEAQKTTVLLRKPFYLVFMALWIAISRPFKFLGAFLLTMKLWWRSERGLIQHLAYLIEASFLVDATSKKQCDHLHAHFGTNSATVAMLCHLLGGPPYSFTVHGPEEFDHPYALALDLKIHHSKFVVAISKFGRSQLMRWCSFAEWKKIQIVHCAIEQSLLDETPTPVPDNAKLVCVGRLVEQKGQLVLLEAVRELRDRGVQVEVTVVGDGPFRDVLEAEISKHRLQAEFKLAGWKTGEETLELIQQSRGMVLSSFAEGLPVVIMEAYALNRPVIATYVAGIPELVSEGENGWLVPASDASALANAMEKLLTNPIDLLTQLAAQGCERVQKFHSSDKEAQNLDRLIKAYYK